MPGVPFRDSNKDYGDRAANWLVALGVLSLAGCNFAGLLFIWFACRIRQKRSGFRTAALWLTGAYVVTAVGLALWALAFGTSGMRLRLGPWEYESPPLWLSVLACGVLATLFALPYAWLVAPGTVRAFRAGARRGLCPACGYDLRATPARCPECGHVPADTAAAKQVDQSTS